MNRSVFTKYMAAFAGIIFVSFLLLAIIISSLVGAHATSTLQNEVKNTAAVTVQVLEDNFQRRSVKNQFQDYVIVNQDRIHNLLSGIGESTNERMLLIADVDGKVLCYVNACEEEIAQTNENGTGKERGVPAPLLVPNDVMQSLFENSIYEEKDTMSGFFKERFLTCGIPVKEASGEIVGAVFASSSSESEDSLISVMNRTVILASFWVMLAAMIAVYFISDRITSPLRTMTNAAKEFAHGKMDARVEIKGNDEITALGRAFNDMADSLAETEKMRNSFLANVSHDLRTPMTTIAGFVDGIINGSVPEEKENDYLELVSSEVHRLSRLVGQILDVSRLESGERKFTNARFDVCEMARLILISFEQKIDEKHLEVEFQCETDTVYAFGDSDATHQVLYNLCDNAIKFAREGGVFRIGISVDVPGRIFVSVYNEGLGIPSSDLPYVFERFYKSDKSRGLDKSGVGLGLYIVKAILEAQQQTIEVNSVQGEYCEFRFTLKEDRSL